MHVRHRTLAPLASLTLAATLLAVAPAAAQQHDMSMPTEGLRADLLMDLDILEQKYTSLAEATTDHYAWRPAEDVRSVSEVFTHIAGANLYIPVLFEVDPPAGMEVASMQEAFGKMQEMERQVTDPAAVMERLEAGFAHARHAIASVADEDLDDPIDLFGQQATKRAGLVLMVTHMHEHLGQAVAYARMNGVVPPWSQGG